MIPCQRDLFEVPRDIAYLNCAYFSPQLRSVTEIGRQSVDRKSRPWEITAADFFEDNRLVKEAFASIVGGAAEEVSIAPSASYGVGVAAANLPVERGQNLVVLAEQFPSNVYPWKARAQEREAELRTVPRPADGDWCSAVLEHLDADTAVVALPEYHWTDGSHVDLAPIIARARELGAAVVLDLTQSLGAVPFSVRETPVDFVVAAAYKWLLCPYSVAYLWSHPRHHSGRPIEFNWISREDSEDFANVIDYRDRFQPGAKRFDVGELSNFVLMPMALRALQQLREWGIAEIAATLRHMTDRIAEGARELGLEAPADAQRGPHLLGLRSPRGLPDDLLARLAARNVLVSQRGDALRIAPHLYNDETDVERLLAALREVLQSSGAAP